MLKSKEGEEIGVEILNGDVYDTRAIVLLMNKRKYILTGLNIVIKKRNKHGDFYL